jgi:hypothetical protein
MSFRLRPACPSRSAVATERVPSAARIAGVAVVETGQHSSLREDVLHLNFRDPERSGQSWDRRSALCKSAHPIDIDARRVAPGVALLAHHILSPGATPARCGGGMRIAGSRVLLARAPSLPCCLPFANVGFACRGTILQMLRIGVASFPEPGIACFGAGGRALFGAVVGPDAKASRRRGRAPTLVHHGCGSGCMQRKVVHPERFERPTLRFVV